MFSISTVIFYLVFQYHSAVVQHCWFPNALQMIRTVTSHCIPMRKGKFINCLSSGGTTQTLGIFSKPKAVVQFYVSVPYNPWGQRQELLCSTDLADCLGHAVCKINIYWLNEGEMRLKKKTEERTSTPRLTEMVRLAHSCFSATRGSVVLRLKWSGGITHSRWQNPCCTCSPEYQWHNCYYNRC